MPKVKSIRVKLDAFVNAFGNDVFSHDGKVLFCKICAKEVNSDTKFLISQHTNGVRHKSLLDKRSQSTSSSVVQLIPFLQASGKKSQFALELCDTLLSTDIPLRKVDHEKLSSFLEKWTKQTVPCSATLRLNYIKDVYESKLEFIRKCVESKAVWISVDETTDVTGRFVANVVVGTLETTESRCFLLNVEFLEKTNSSTISQVFMNSLTLLWPSGIKHDQVLLFVSDGAAYIKKAGSALKVMFPRMLHVTCAAHALHRMAEEVRTMFPAVDKLVSNGKKVFLKSASRATLFREMVSDTPLPPQPCLTRWGIWLTAALYYAKHYDAFSTVVDSLDESDAVSIQATKQIIGTDYLPRDLAFIEAHFGNLPTVIERLENQQFLLTESTDLFEETMREMGSVPGSRGEALLQKSKFILMRNPDYDRLKAIANVLRGIPSPISLDEFTPGERASFKYAPITSTDVERTFSKLKHMLNDRRHNFTAENLKMALVAYCNNV